MARLSRAAPITCGRQRHPGYYCQSINPFAYLADVIARVQDHPAQRLDELLRGAWADARATWLHRPELFDLEQMAKARPSLRTGSHNVIFSSGYAIRSGTSNLEPSL
jgi:hypothetical protein